MLQVKLDKNDVVNLLCGIDPSYNQMKLAKGLGNFSGSLDRWMWNRKSIHQLGCQEIFSLYIKLKG